MSRLARQAIRRHVDAAVRDALDIYGDEVRRPAVEIRFQRERDESSAMRDRALTALSVERSERRSVDAENRLMRSILVRIRDNAIGEGETPQTLAAAVIPYEKAKR